MIDKWMLNELNDIQQDRLSEIYSALLIHNKNAPFLDHNLTCVKKNGFYTGIITENVEQCLNLEELLNFPQTKRHQIKVMITVGRSTIIS